MKHWLRQHEALACARMKRSAFSVPNVPKAHFIAEGDFIFHALLGALHSAKTKRQAMPVLLFWRRRRDSNSRTVLSVTRFPVVRPRPAKRLLHIILPRFFKRLVIISQHFRLVNINLSFFLLFCVYYLSFFSINFQYRINNIIEFLFYGEVAKCFRKSHTRGLPLSRCIFSWVSPPLF